MKKIITVVGARPQFIKAAAISRELKNFFHETLIHTGQHYDKNMSDIFFSQLDIPKPDINLQVGSGLHGEQTANMIVKLEKIFLEVKPSLIIIYGDTNSTLAASIAASKIHIPVAHVEAGLRNYDLTIPEEVNRVVADKLSDYLFVPSQIAVENLKKEGITKNVFNTGDVMVDSLHYGLEIAKTESTILSDLGITKKGYCLATIHRAENTNDVGNLKEIMLALGEFTEKVILPIHPRTKKVLLENKIFIPLNVQMIPSLGYIDFISLQSNARIILTDSGGVQKEAYCLKVPCITIFPSTSWVETVEDGWNKLADANKASILKVYHSKYDSLKYNAHYGDGFAAKKIVEIISKSL
jgi:UDP-GlcNAc3NAcA epimerase